VKDPFVRGMMQLAETDPRVMLLTGDLGFGAFEPFEAKFPRQFLNVGVAEQNMIGVATGLALEGYIPFCYSIANFATLRCLEQIRNDAAYHDANVKVVAIGGGFSYGALGISHHATEDIAIMRALPGIVSVVPGDDWEAEESTKALAARPGTAYLRLDKSSAGNTSTPGEAFEIGRARVVRQGAALTLITTGGILGEVLAAAKQLAADAVACRVLSMHTIKPLDSEAVLAAARETGGIITIEEHTVDGGLGAAIAEVLMDAGCTPRRFLRMGLRQGFSSVVGSQTYLRSKYDLDAPAMVRAARALLKRSS
jgi:transketolase